MSDLDLKQICKEIGDIDESIDTDDGEDNTWAAIRAVAVAKKLLAEAERLRTDLDIARANLPVQTCCVCDQSSTADLMVSLSDGRAKHPGCRLGGARDV